MMVFSSWLNASLVHVLEAEGLLGRDHRRKRSGELDKRASFPRRR